MINRYETTLLVALHVTVMPAGEAWANYEGQYVFVGGERQRQGRIDQIELVVSGISVFLRSFARERLRSVCKLPPSISVQREENQMGIALVPLPMRWTKLDGSTSFFTNVRGRKATIWRQRNGRTISEVVTEGRSKRLIDYRFRESSDRLDLRYVIQSPYLPQDVVYSLSYAKTNPAETRQAQR